MGFAFWAFRCNAPLYVQQATLGLTQATFRRCISYRQCTLINFIATEKGLEDQLLAKVVGVERPELEKQAQELQAAFNQVTHT